jgi:hypothetical protein
VLGLALLGRLVAVAEGHIVKRLDAQFQSLVVSVRCSTISNAYSTCAR